MKPCPLLSTENEEEFLPDTGKITKAQKLQRTKQIPKARNGVGKGCTVTLITKPLFPKTRTDFGIDETIL